MSSTVEAAAHEVLLGCRSTAFDGVSPIFAPDASGNYEGTYWRDFCYLLEGLGGEIPVEDVERAVRYLLEPLAEGQTLLHKSRRADGTLVYNWQDPVPTADSPSAETSWLFSADNPMFAVKVVDQYLRLGGKLSLFREYAGRLERVLDGVTLSENHLVKDDVGPYVYGFYDSVSLTGEECFASVLFFDAAVRLSGMLEASGESAKAKSWMDRAGKTRDGLKHLRTGEQGMLLSDTGTNRQVDVWGSAFAVYVGAVRGEQASLISDWLAGNYDSCVRWGHVRHIPRPHYWKGPFTDIVYPAVQPRGHYQNGGYWSVPAPWVAHAIALADRSLAGRMICDLERALIEYRMPECINEDGSTKLPGYAASAAMGALAVAESRSR